MEELGLMDFFGVFKRRKRLFVFVFGALFLASAFFAFRWSNYRSMATVEISLPEISAAATATGSPNAPPSREAIADLRISYLQQKVLSTGSLVEIITKYNLYPSEREKTPIADVAERMRRKIKLSLLSPSLANPSTAQKASSAIAFNLSFDYSQPLLTQQVTNEIVTRFLDEDIKQRRGQAKETTAFLEAQLKVMEESLAEQEKKIAEYRTAYGETRPEALAFNQQAATSIMMSIQGLEAQITSNIGQQGALRAQLASIDPYSRVVGDGQVLTTPTIQLRALKSEYAMLTAKYGPDHPDVIKVTKQIEAMESAQKKGPQAGALRALIGDAKARLDSMARTHGEENPDVVALRREIAGYEAQLKALPNSQTPEGGLKADADNPAYLQVVAQLRASEEQAKALQAQKASLQEQLQKHQSAVIENPLVEQQLAALTRDYQNSQIHYRELKAKKLDSEMNETIEQDRMGQRLVIINPPELPLGTKPSRLLFLMAGFVLSFVASAALLGGSQFVRPRVLGMRHLELLTGAPPLVALPHISTSQERKRIRSWHASIVFGGAVLFVLALVAFSYLVMPLDVFVSVIALKLGLG